VPIYEYRCAGCDARFEELVRNSDAEVACPSCGGVAVERLISTFARVGGSKEPVATWSGGGQSHSCGPGCGHHHH
jgi:putative FmdB family regulatory protein